MMPKRVNAMVLQSPAMAVFCIIVFAIAGCGGGGGDNGAEGTRNVTISGNVDDGAENSPIQNAYCRFVDLSGNLHAAGYSGATGEYSLSVPSDIDGIIICSPTNLPNLRLETVVSTVGAAAGSTIAGEDLNPLTTFVTQKIRADNPPDWYAQKDELLASLASHSDAYLNLIAELSTRLFVQMYQHGLNTNFANGVGGEGGDGGDGGDGGGAGGEAGDGGDFSPIAYASCEFVIGNNLGDNRNVLYNAALADFRDNGIFERPDCDAIKDDVNNAFAGRENEIIQAFNAVFPNGFGLAYHDTADENGNYFLPIPPNVSGFVRCTPPGQENMILATYVPKRDVGETLLEQDVNPATTIFSTSIATELSANLEDTKENYLDDIAGLKVYVRTKQRDGVNVTFYSLCEPAPGTVEPPDNCNPQIANQEVGMVAFSATSLFNSFYKNGVNGDYLAALDNLTSTGSVNVEDLKVLGMPAEQADELSDNVDRSAQDLNTGLEAALSSARIRVMVSDLPGAMVIPGAQVDLLNSETGIACANCPGTTDSDGVFIIQLTGVSSTAEAITVRVYNVPGYVEVASLPTEVVAFATTDLNIAMTASVTEHSLTVTRTGTGSGTVISSPAGIDCGPDCDATYVEATAVTLTATPAADSTFSGWSGNADCSDGIVTMNTDVSCTATFTLIPPPPPEYDLSVTWTGTGSGTVVSSPAGIDCGDDCHWIYPAGTMVILTANPTDESIFAGWIDGICGTDNPCTVNMDQAHTLTALFNLPGPPEISNINYALGQDSDSCVNSSGDYFSGTTYTITFSYEDPDGDAHEQDGAAVYRDGMDITQWCDFSGDGFSGSVDCYLCSNFFSTTQAEMVLVDSRGTESNPLTVTVRK